MKNVFVGAFLLFNGLLLAQPAGYYDDAAGKTGSSLQQALHDIIDGHTVKSYNYLWTAFSTTDKKADGTVWDMYSDRPGGEPPYVFYFGSDQCGNYSGESSCYNREHSFPKSWFGGEVSPMYTDLFHLVPTDGYVNGKRNNFPFGETNSPTWTSKNGSKLGPCSVNGYSGTVFEPIDEYKGDFARNYFYMAVRYFGEDKLWPGSPMVDGSQLEPWAKEMMVRWHEDDPVSPKETKRNDAVYEIQKNRNPFIDHPEYVYQMYGGESFDEIPPTIDSITILSATGVCLWFNEELDSENAIVYTHYTISGNIDVLGSAFADESHTSILLETSELQNGSYALTINGVSDTAGNVLQLAIYNFSLTSLDNVDFAKYHQTKIFPNPSSGELFIRLSEKTLSLEQLRLLDISGRVVAVDVYLSGDLIELHTSALPGSYILQLRFTSGYETSRKILIE